MSEFDKEKVNRDYRQYSNHKPKSPKLTYHVSNSDNNPAFAQARQAATNRNRRNKPTLPEMPWSSEPEK